jgi:hypothetical protein
MVHCKTTLTYHLFHITIGELIAAIPSDAQKDKSWLEVTPFEER